MLFNSKTKGDPKMHSNLWFSISFRVLHSKTFCGINYFETCSFTYALSLYKAFKIHNKNNDIVLSLMPKHD